MRQDPISLTVNNALEGNLDYFLHILSEKTDREQGYIEYAEWVKKVAMDYQIGINRPITRDNMRAILAYTIEGNRNINSILLSKLLAGHGMVLSPIRIDGTVTNGKRVIWKTAMNDEELKAQIALG